MSDLKTLANSPEVDYFSGQSF